MRIEKRIKLMDGQQVGETITHVKERWQDWFWFGVTWDYVGDGLPLPFWYVQYRNDKLMHVYYYCIWYLWPFGKILSLFKNDKAY